jgi:predicted ATPase
MRELGDATADVPTQVLGRNAHALTCFTLGEFATGQDLLKEALALYDPAHRPVYLRAHVFDTLVMSQAHSAYVLTCLGYLDQALFQQEAALCEARRLSHPPTLTFALASIGFAGTWRSRLDPGSLLQYADECLALAGQQGHGHFRMVALIQRGWCLAALGRADEGIPLVTAGAAGLRDLGFLLWRPWALTLLADACRMAGEWQAALERLAEARHLAEESGERWLQAETLRLTGDVLLATGDAAAAETSYCEATAIAEEQSAKLWELRAATSLASLWRDQEKRAEAHELLKPIYSWFTEGFGTPVLQEAKALLEELAG